MQTKKFARIINKPVSVWKRMDAHTIEWRLCVGSFARSFVSFFLSRNGVRDAWLYLNRDLNQRWLRTIYCCVMSLFPSLARSFSLSLSHLLRIDCRCWLFSYLPVSERDFYERQIASTLVQCPNLMRALSPSVWSMTHMIRWLFSLVLLNLQL